MRSEFESGESKLEIGNVVADNENMRIMFDSLVMEDADLRDNFKDDDINIMKYRAAIIKQIVLRGD
jgi:hypothetical protein